MLLLRQNSPESSVEFGVVDERVWRSESAIERSRWRPVAGGFRVRDGCRLREGASGACTLCVWYPALLRVIGRVCGATPPDPRDGLRTRSSRVPSDNCMHGMHEC